MNLDLTGKVALIGGASKGLGYASAVELARSGCRTILIGRQADLLKQRCDELHAINGQQHHFIAIDVAQHQTLEDNVKKILSEHGPIHILINNSGGPPSGLISEASADDFLNAFNQHVQVNALLARLLIPGMKQEKFGRIINIISVSVKTPVPNLGVSNTTRWAVAAWAKTLAGELAPYGITVNNVLPGAISTDRLTELFKAQATRSGTTPQDASEAWRKEIPMGRFGEPSEFGNVVAFLASPAASYVTGVALPIDGGRTPCL